MSFAGEEVGRVAGVEYGRVLVDLLGLVDPPLVPGNPPEQHVSAVQQAVEQAL